MKKIIVFATLLLALSAGNRVMAQMQIDCDEAVAARYDFNRDVLDVIDEAKYNLICNESKVAFEFVDAIPEGAVVYQITDLTDRKLNRQVDDTYDELTLCSLYRFNYRQYQFQARGDRDIYFQLPAGHKHPYMLLHSYKYICETVNAMIQNINNN